MFRRMTLALAVGAATLGVTAGQASAADVGVTTAKRLVFTANAGEANAVTMTPAGDGVTINDTGAALSNTTYAGTCTLGPDSFTATCPGVLSVSVRLGDMSDALDMSALAQAGVVLAGDGNDLVAGGTGNDRIVGEGGRDTITANGGNDLIKVRGGAIDSVNCGDGADTVDADAADYLDASCETTPTSGGGSGGGSGPGPAQGEAPLPPRNGSGPKPILLPSAPGTPSPVAIPSGKCPTLFKGTGGADRIDGTGKGDRMFGFGGRDILNGLGGNDCLYGGKGSDQLYAGRGSDVIRAGKDADRVYAGTGSDKVYGEKGNDRLYGQNGNDRLNGGKGRDRIYGGRGNDRIDARDGQRDVVRCGSGRDTAKVDRKDRVSGCEKVRRRG